MHSLIVLCVRDNLHSYSSNWDSMCITFMALLCLIVHCFVPLSPFSFSFLVLMARRACECRGSEEEEEETEEDEEERREEEKEEEEEDDAATAAG